MSVRQGSRSLWATFTREAPLSVPRGVWIGGLVLLATLILAMDGHLAAVRGHYGDRVYPGITSTASTSEA